MSAWLLLAVVALAAAAWEFYLVYLRSDGRHRRVTAAQAARRRAAARIRVRLHQARRPAVVVDEPRIPWQRVAPDDHLVEAAGAAARRDRDLLLAGLAQIGN